MLKYLAARVIYVIRKTVILRIKTILNDQTKNKRREKSTSLKKKNAIALVK